MKQDKTENSNVTVLVDFYHEDNQVIVFVNGYALADHSINAAYNIASALGQDEIVMTIYQNKTIPYKVRLKV